MGEAMSGNSTVPKTARYVLTDQGKRALDTPAQLCHCTIRFAGLVIECPECGTVYGLWRDAPLPAA